MSEQTAEIIQHEPKPKRGRAVAIHEDRPPAPTTPTEMLALALQSGASAETLEKLMALQERFEANQARKAFNAAVAEAKSKIKPVVRNREGHNKKTYADFAAIASAVDPILNECGLSYRFRTAQGERISVTCVLAHRDGHSEETTLTGPADTSGNKNAIQAIGSTLTYLQRYSLVQALGLAAADDDDGNAAGASGTITDEQADHLRDLITEVQADAVRFLAFMGVESLTQIPANQFARAKQALEAKRRRR